jgi:hypothetical protein
MVTQPGGNRWWWGRWRRINWRWNRWELGDQTLAVEVAVLEMAGRRNGGNGGSGVVIIKVPSSVTATFTGATFGNNSPDFDNSLPITSVSGFNIYVVSQGVAATVVFN